MADDEFEHGSGGVERRQHARFDAELCVDWTSDENFLFAYITNISEMGIFIRTDDPPPVGTALKLRFAMDGEAPLELRGVVVWINPLRPSGENLNPGMGVRFDALTADQRERVVALVKRVAYLQDDGN
ncbi:MAG TPA: TIGR02266 family protein [Sandaracinaceae bacterium]